MIFTISGFMVLQVFVFMAIFYFLKHSLQKNLVEMAIHQFEMLLPHDLDPAINEIKVVAFSPLSLSLQERLRHSAIKKLRKEVRVSVMQDKGIKGGLIIKCGSKIIDTSLINRLKECGWAKYSATQNG